MCEVPSDDWANGDYVDVVLVWLVWFRLFGELVLFYGTGVEFRDKKCVEVKCQQNDIPGI